MLKRIYVSHSAALYIVFSLLGILIIVTGVVYLRFFSTQYSHVLNGKLAAIASSEANQTGLFRDSRLAEANALSRNTQLPAAVTSIIQGTQGTSVSLSFSEIVYPLVSVQQFESISLVSGDGQKIYFTTGAPIIPPRISGQINDIVKSGETDFTDIYLDDVSQHPVSLIVVPLVFAGMEQPIALLCQVDYEAELYPFTTGNLNPDADDRTYLLQLQGGANCLVSPMDSVDSSLNRLIPVAETDHPAIKVVKGQLDQINGSIDAVEVIGFGASVPHSNWFILVTEPESVAGSPVHQMLLLVLLFVGSLLIGISAAIFGTILDTNEIRRKDREIQQKNVEMEQFTYTVTHDLKSPVVTVKTFLNYLVQDIKQPDAADQVNQDVAYIRNAADRMSRLLDELLKMSRIGHRDNPPEKMTFNSIVEEAVNTVAGRLSQKGVRTVIATEDIVLFGDRSRMLEIWQNLVENSVKYIGDQLNPEIVIGFERRNKEIAFFVRDNGIGISPEFHEKVFGVFTKLNADSEGTGLGLAVVKKIVEVYNGKIWVESSGMGAGSTFKFTLPDAVRSSKATS
jgi:signal transduction histidine kinase